MNLKPCSRMRAQAPAHTVWNAFSTASSENETSQETFSNVNKFRSVSPKQCAYTSFLNILQQSTERVLHQLFATTAVSFVNKKFEFFESSNEFLWLTVRSRGNNRRTRVIVATRIIF